MAAFIIPALRDMAGVRLSHQWLGNLTTTKKTGTILLFTEGVISVSGVGGLGAV
jgi:hypothetical protein